MAKRGVIIVAGGSGSRMHSSVPKQFMIVGGEPVVARTINTFSEALPGADIVVVLPEEHIAMWKNMAARFDVAVHRCVAGVHDGVRALATKRLVLRAMLAAEEHEAVIPVVDVVDSYRRVEGDESHIVPRASLRIVQTPQTFKADVLRKAYSLPFDTSFTDDASVVEAAGYRVSLVDGERQNIKLTTPEDVEYAEWILSRE